MSDLTVGEIKKVLQVNLFTVDETQNPPVQVPLDLTTALSVILTWVITPPVEKPAAVTDTVQMQVTDAVNGIVQYVFQSGDLDKPSNMGKYGQFRFSIQVNFSDGTVLITNEDGQLTIKDDSVL